MGTWRPGSALPPSDGDGEQRGGGGRCREWPTAGNLLNSRACRGQEALCPHQVLQLRKGPLAPLRGRLRPGGDTAFSGMGETLGRG